ncbi:MAG TPA: response regulator [Vicinamibacterales bacterium]|nr:response regulator [Vicinamibacterales bacterium]
MTGRPPRAAHPDVLLVEDSEQDAELTLRVLQRHELAARVVWVRDGAEALDYVFGTDDDGQSPLAAAPRVVLLDIKMPRVDGHEVLRRMKSDRRSRHIPVVIMSSSGVEQDIAWSLAGGANSYIVKPVGYDAFSETVRQVGSYWLRVHQPAEGR